MTDYYRYINEIPDVHLVERLLAGHPDAEQLIAIITRSYDYIQKLPLKGISETSYRKNPELFDLTL